MNLRKVLLPGMTHSIVNFSMDPSRIFGVIVSKPIVVFILILIESYKIRLSCKNYLSKQNQI